MKKLIAAAAIALSIQNANAFTGPQLTWMVAATSAVSAIFTLIEGEVFGEPSTDGSTKSTSSSNWKNNNEALLRQVSEDAAAFVANDGQGATALLKTIIEATREEHLKIGYTNEATDTDIALALIAAVEGK